MANARKLTVTIAGDAKGLISTVREADSALSGLGKVFTGAAILGGFAALTGGAIALGQAAYNLGGQFNSAFDSIQVATGATGAELDGLQDTFREVFSEVPSGMGDVATAVGQLNARLDITGATLETTSESLLNFTRLTGSDTASAVNLITRTMGDWGVTTEDTTLLMDKLFVAQQETGVGWETLADQVVQFGAPLRQLGFNLDTSIALLAKFNSEGVNTELVMGSMRIALGKLSKVETDESSTVRTSTVDRKAQARAIADAQKAIEDAAKGVLDANEKVIESQKELDELLKGPTVEDAAEASISLEEASVDQQKAVERLTDAQVELSDAQADGDPTKIRKAMLAFRDAQLALTRAEQRTEKAQRDLNEVTNWSADTDEKVIDARGRVKDAQDGVAEAEDRVIEAQERLNDAQTRSVGSAGASRKETDLLADTVKRLGVESAPAEEQFKALVDEIKNAEDPTAATRLGMELFGARAGPDMVAAIREGRFDGLAPLVADLEGAGGTVGDTAAATEDFSERFQIAMNNLKLAVEPIVSAMFGWFADELGPVIERFGKTLNEEGLGAAVEELKTTFKENWPQIRQALIEAVADSVQWLIDHADDFVKAWIEFGRLMGEGMAIGIIAGIVENVPGAKEFLGTDTKAKEALDRELAKNTHHTGGTFHAPTPGGEGWAWLRDGERVSTPGGGMGAPVVIVKLDNQTLASAQARFDKRNVATVIAG